MTMARKLREFDLGWIFHLVMAGCKVVTLAGWMLFWFLFVVYGMAWAGEHAREVIRGGGWGGGGLR